MNRSCSKAETLSRRTDTFDPVSFPVYMLSFHAFLKRKTVKRTLLQADNIFSPQIKKQPALRGHKNFRNFRETENQIRHFCQCSQKETFFYTSTQHFLFLISICSFEGVHTFDSNSLSFSKLLSATNQQLLLRHGKRYRPSNHIAPLSTVTYIKLW